MSATDQALLKAQTVPLPQYFNEKNNRFEATTGRDGAASFIEKGRVVKDAFSGSDNVTKSYGTKMFGFAIVNDGIADLSFAIGSLTVVVKPGETFEDLFDAFTTVRVTATSAYRAVVRE